MAKVKGEKIEYDVIVLTYPEGVSQSCTFEIRAGSYNYKVYLDRYPTQNCQLTSIGCMNNLLCLTKNKIDIRAILKEIYHLAGHSPSFILIDVQDIYEKDIVNCFGGEIRMKHPYISPNDSSMWLFLVDGRGLKI